MFRQLLAIFAPPIFEDDEDKTHLAKLINYFAWVIFLGTSFFYVVWTITSPALAWRLVYGIPLFPLAGAIFFFLRRKNLKSASLILVIGIWLVLFLSAIFNGGLHAPAMGGFILVVLLAALLLGRQNALGFAVLSIVATLGLVFAQNSGLISGERFATPMAIWSSYTTYLIVSALLLHVGTSNIQEALSRARVEIHERKHTEEALREAELRYRTLVEKLPVVTYQDIPDQVGTSLYISPQIEKLIGYTPDVWIDDPLFWHKLLHPDDHDRVIADIEEYIKRKGSSVIEYRLRTKDNQWVWVRDEADVLSDENGMALLVQGTLSDITAQKQAEEALRASEEKFNKAFYFSPYPMSISSPSRGYIEVNEAFLTLLGRSRDEIIGQHALDIRFWAEPEEQTKAVEILFREGWLLDFEFRFQKKSGDIGIGLSSAALITINEEPCALASVFDLTHRKQAEEALRASEEKFQKAFQASPVAMVISSPEKGIMDVNENFVTITGFTREDLLGKSSLNVGFWVNSKDQEAMAEILLSEGTVQNTEFQFQRKSGEIRQAIGSAVLVEIEEKPCSLASIFDITDRKYAEEALRASEEKFQKAFQFSPIAMAISSRTRGYLDINDAFVKITGYTREETLGYFSADIGLWLNTELHKQMLAKILETGFARDVEIEFRRKTGDTGIALASAVLIEFDNESCILASIYDITDRKKSEKAVLASEEKFQKAFLSSPVSMVINSPMKGILNVNRAFEELTGFERAEVLGRHMVDVGLWVNLDERQHTIEEVRKRGSLQDFEFQFRKKDSEIRIGNLAVDLIDIEDEKCYLASFQDITSRKQAEEALRNINVELEARVHTRTAQLESANRELESFSYSVSHDLRAPLRAINGFSRILMEEYQAHLPAEAQRLQNLVQENALKMARLIDDLLTFSRLGRAPLQMVPIQPAELAREVWDDLKHERENRDFEITIHELPPCRADPNLLRQVFANLLGNAIKFTRLRTNAIIEIGNKKMDNKDVYYIKDNGAGFDMEYADKLFGVFQRLHRDTEFEGTGVGLATVQRIIHRHRGEIWAEGETNRGATFYFTLPALSTGR